MKHLLNYKLFESQMQGTLQLSKGRLFSLMRMIMRSEIKEINNSQGKLEIVYGSPRVDVSKLFSHMKFASFEYTSTITNQWAEAEIRAWDPYELENRKTYILKTGRYSRKSKEYQAIIHIFMKHMIDSGRPIQY